MDRGVLVEQGVVEDEAGLADARGPVDQGDLAQAGSAVVARDVGADQVLSLVGADLDCAAALEADLAGRATTVPWICSGYVARNDAVDAAGVGGGEDLLGRHVRDVLDAARDVAGARCHSRRPGAARP